MTFWIIAAGLAGIVAVVLAVALRATRTASTEPAAAYDLRVYRDQLREVDKDLARGTVSEADAERVRAEVSRRILAADAALTADAEDVGAARGAPALVGALLAVALIGGSIGLYLLIGAPGYGDLGLKNRIEQAETLRAERPSQQQAEASLPAYVTPPDASPDYVALVERLRQTVAERGDDLQGLTLLAQNEANLGNFSAAAQAQAEVIRLKGPGVTTADLTDYADLLVLAAGGYVSPEAEAVINQALSRAPTDGTARYYLGLMQAQTGRPDRAFRLWDQLLREGPEGAPWIRPILAQIEEMAFRAGVNYQLPEIGSSSETARGPSAEDIEAAGEMTPAERLEMIEGMVAGLSDRLATDGGPPQDWAQLITALGVLGRTQQARAVYDNAIDAFAENDAAIDAITRAGQQAGVAE